MTFWLLLAIIGYSRYNKTMATPTKFDTRITQLPPEAYSRIVSAIANIDELKGQWIAGARLHPQLLGSLKQSVLITSTGASTRIEGALLSDEDIEKLMRGISIQNYTVLIYNCSSK